MRKLITLRPYQDALQQAIRQAFAQGCRRVLAVAPTGSGKTVVFSHIARITSQRKKKVLILAHRLILLEQCGDKLYSNYVDFGYLNPAYTPSMWCDVQLGTMQTVVKRMATLGFYPDLIIVDEAHQSLSATYWAIINYFKDAYILGVTATPIRSDGKPLGDMFDTMVLGPGIQELIDMGNLVAPKTYAPLHKVDLSHVDTGADGDYNKKQLASVMNNSAIIGDAVAHYSRICPGVPAVTFCVDIVNSKNTARQFQEANWGFEHIDGDMSQKYLKSVYKAVATGKLHGITSVDLATTGLDIPALQAAIMLRGTKNEGLFVQMGGRVLRPDAGKHNAYILDHCGATLLHGLITDEREWSLYAPPKKKRGPRGPNMVSNKIYYTCNSCNRTYEAAPICPGCGMVSASALLSVNHAAELQEVTMEEALKLKARRSREIGSAETLADFEKIEAARGYYKGWALHAFNTLNSKLNLH